MSFVAALNYILRANMKILVLLGILASACAAPHYHRHHGGPPPFHDDILHQRYFQDDIFDTRSFWDEIRKELLNIDAVVNDFVKHFPSSVSSELVDGDVYKVTIPLPGFEEKDIVVKAKKGLVMVQAVHNYGSGIEKTYIDMRTLPADVNETGSWTYKDEVLKIEFPINGKTINTPVTTQLPSFSSREEMEEDKGDSNQNADVGAQRGDVDTLLLTNEIPRGNSGVEATTYAVDLTDAVEFVPVRQVK